MFSPSDLYISHLRVYAAPALIRFFEQRWQANRTGGKA